MGTKLFTKAGVATLVHYVALAWTIFCIVGTWFVILRYGIILQGLFAVFLFSFFSAAIWTIPLSVLIIVSLFMAPSQDPPPSVPFKELIRKGMRRSFG